MEQQRRRQTNVEQLGLLINFLEQHKDLALGRVRSKEARALSARLWRECSLSLNAEGPARTGKEWAKIWNDLKCRVRSKLVNINAAHQGTGGGPSNPSNLTAIEERIASIIGTDIGPLPNVRQDPFATQNDDSNIEEVAVAEHAPEPLDYEIQNEIIIGEQILQQSLEEQREEPSPVPSTAQGPSVRQPSPSPSNERNRRQRMRRAAARSAVSSVPPPAQSNRTALEESRLMVLKIENLRAEAALINAQANKTLADSLKLLAESVDCFTNVYTASHRHEGASTEDN